MVASVPPPSENGGLSAAAILPMAKEKERKSRSKEKLCSIKTVQVGRGSAVVDMTNLLSTVYSES